MMRAPFALHRCCGFTDEVEGRRTTESIRARTSALKAPQMLMMSRLMAKMSRGGVLLPLVLKWCYRRRCCNIYWRSSLCCVGKESRFSW